MKTDVPPASPPSRIQKDCNASDMKNLVLARQREYKVAAVQAKQNGDLGMAKQHYLMVKRLDTVVEAFSRGDFVDISSLPPPPGSAAVEKQFSAQPPTSLHAAPPVANSAVPAPNSLAEALQQRMQRYKTAAEDAKTKGDDRKARMHLRIVKQYQGAIQAHKAGRPVSLSELPIPPGCPPLQGLESGEQSFAGVLEAAMKLASQDADEEEGEEQREEVPKVLMKAVSHRAKAPAPPSPKLRAPGTPLAPGQGSAVGSKAQQQLDFLLARRQQFVRAALRSKHMNDMQGAALHLRHAKGLDHMITAAKGGCPLTSPRFPVLQWLRVTTP
ncbi:hypothetical protein AGOR_G00226770 [Albula goreensis]|uniref:DM14 domain-containing protein n=1 Tax=Albula goreensis TaxID=1534307 RepID=A0A8T3CP31_9TELE|nr:hypothetical protein AGOR_G00226770 [Albula goreensis]